MICERLHRAMAASVANIGTTQLLPPRTKIQVSRSTSIRPDLALITTATGRLWLAVEIVHRGDHHPDTVMKKEVYEQVRVPRLWMVDPRYDNVEVYHGTQYGLTLKRVLAVRDLLTEALLPGFQLGVHELFAGPVDGREAARYDF